MLEVRDDHPLRRMFAGLVEDAFCSQIGVCDPSMTDYLTNMLVDFTHVDQLHRLIEVEWQQIEQLSAMLCAAFGVEPQKQSDYDCEAYRRIGDYSLFWAGLYPERLRGARADDPDALCDQVFQGRQSYALAADLAGDDSQVSSELLLHLSRDFECCVHGLGLVRRGWEEAGRQNGDQGTILQ